MTITLSQAPAADLTIMLNSSDAAKVSVPATVVVPHGATSATIDSISAAGIGSATITASASGYASGTATITVTAPTPGFTPAALPVNPNMTGTLTLNLANGQAPAGGLTMDLTSSAPAVATVPAKVNFAAGATSATVTVTGVAAGSTQITATAPGFTSSATATVTVPGQITLNNVSAVLGGTANLTVTLSVPAAAGGLTVSFASSAPTKVPVPANIIIAAGQTTGSASVAGIGIGSSTITATATGYLAGTSTVTVPAPTMSFTGAPLTITTGSNGTVTLKLSGGQGPVGGLTVNLSSAATSVITVPGSVTFGQGVSSMPVTVTGVAAGGPVAITASIPGTASTATAQVSVSPVSNCQTTGTISMLPVSVGKNLQVVASVDLSPAAPTGGLTFNVTSLDPTKVLVAGHPTDAGSQQVTFKGAQGQTSITGIYLQGLVSSGTALLQFTAPNYCGQAVVTLTPSGFTLTGPGGASSITTNAGAAAMSLTVSAVQLDSSLAVQPGTGQVRGGATVSVSLTSTNGSVGTVSSPVVFHGSDSTHTSTFTPSATTGTATLSAVTPSGFSTPATSKSVTVTVQPMAMSCSSTTVGKRLESTASCTLQGTAPKSPVTVVITSSDASRLLLSNTPDGIGAGSITVTTTCFQNICQATTPSFYVYGLDDHEDVTYSASASGYGTGTGTVTLTPSGFVLAGPSGVGQAFTAFPTSIKGLTVYSAQLDSSGTFMSVATLAPGSPAVTVIVGSDNLNAGTVDPADVTIATGSSAGTTVFTAGSPSTTQITHLAISTPAGFSTPATEYKTVTGTVLGSTIPLRLSCDQSAIGINLQEPCTVSGGLQAAPLVVTLTSNSANLLLSANETAAGSNSIQVTIPAGSSSATYYAQSLANSGTVTHTATASGYNDATATITLGPSAVVISGDVGMGPFQNFFSTSVAGGPIDLVVSTAMLTSSNTFNSVQSLRGGYGPLQVSLSSTPATVGTVSSTITIQAGSSAGMATFTPLKAGSVSVSLTQPAGFVTPASFPASSYTSLVGTVSQVVNPGVRGGRCSPRYRPYHPR